VEQRFAIDRGEDGEKAAVRWVAYPRSASHTWGGGSSDGREGVGSGKGIEKCDKHTSANGLYDYIKGALAIKEVGTGEDACDACRLAYEGMHHDWHQLLLRLQAAKALHVLPSWQAKVEGAGAQAAVMKVGESEALRGLANHTRQAAARLLKWHGTAMVTRHLQLFTSWCRRSGDAGEALTAQQLLDCAQQWSAKVPHGRLGLHEKMMGVCNAGVGAIFPVCNLPASGWQACHLVRVGGGGG